MSERWLPIPGTEGAYEVSDAGRVRSTDRVVMCCGPVKGRYSRVKAGCVLRPGRKPSGHVSVALGRGVGSRDVHVLVLEAFVGPRPEGFEVRHLNGVPDDNRLSNLEYATRSINNQDKKWHKGASCYRLSPAQAREIILALRQGVQGASLAARYGVASSTISAIKQGKFHKDVHASL